VQRAPTADHLAASRSSTTDRGAAPRRPALLRLLCLLALLLPALLVAAPVAAQSDTTGPVISNVQATTAIVGGGNHSITVTWTTDEPATSQLLYGAADSSVDSALVTSHTVIVAGLMPGTTYDYRVKSADAAGNTTTSSSLLITTAPTTVPVVTNVQVTNITETSATVTWTTNIASDGWVILNGSVKGTHSAPVTSHSVPLVDLAPATTYTYMVRSWASSPPGGGYSYHRTFTTAGAADTTAPSVVSRSPAPDATDVDPGVGISITFDEQIGEVQSKRFAVTTAGGEPITGNTNQSADGKTLFFDPAAPLPAATVFTVAVTQIADLNGNAAADVSWSFSTESTAGGSSMGVDTAGPVVSNVQATTAIVGGGNHSITVTWTTDEPATSQLLYGASSSPVSSALVTSHSVTVANLPSGTTFDYRVRSADELENTTTSASALITTAPAGVPVVTNVQVTNVTETSATVTWTTNIPSDSTVFVNGGNEAFLPAMVTSHSVPISGLASGTTYSYTVRSFASTPPGGGYSYAKSFTTGGVPDTTAPAVVSRSPAAGATGVDAGVDISVTFNERLREIQSQRFTVRTASGDAVTGNTNGSADGKTLVFDPAAPLFAGTAYTATVTLIADVNGNQAADVSWSFTVAGVADTTAPTIVARSPVNLEQNVAPDTVVSITFSEPVTGANGQNIQLRGDFDIVVPATVSMPAGSLTATITPSAPLTGGVYYRVLVRNIKDAVGNTMPTEDWDFRTSCPCPGISVFSNYAGTPPTGNAGGPIELGAKFRSSSGGYIIGVRFYRPAGSTGEYVGNLWAGDDVPDCRWPAACTGTLLASAPFTGTEAGWQTATFSTPVHIEANRIYVTSYFAPNGVHAYAPQQYRLTQPWSRTPLTILADGAAGGNGLYRVGSSGFPTSSYNSSNYWADVVFMTTPPPDTRAPRLVDRGPIQGATDVWPGSGVAAVFDEQIDASTAVLTLRDADGAIVPGSLSVAQGHGGISLIPASLLKLATTYTATASAADFSGNAAAPESWSFSTSSCPCTLFDDTATPAVPSVGPGGPIEVGVKFQSAIDGYVTGMRFYKGAGNTGTHVGHLWSRTGTLLATATFSGESPTGWQQVSFSPAVAVTADTTYVASYFLPNGGYAHSGGGWRGWRGPLTTLLPSSEGASGVYRIGSSGFPTSSYNNNNYWADVVFSDTLPPDNTAPTIIARAPAAGSDGAGLGAAVAATFSEPIQPSTLAFTLRTAGGAAVAAQVAYDAATNTATLAPSSPLALGTGYTAEVSGARDTAGNVIATHSWSFSTPACPCTLFADAATPAGFAGAGGGYELGVKFATDVDGYVTGVRFYKGAGNTGTHVGRLWSASGQLLASATFTNEGATGWQAVAFEPAVAVTAGQTYTASYNVPVGGYAYDAGYFTSPVARGPLRATDAGNGVYGGAGQFPQSSYNRANYWVDVVFRTTPPPDVTAPRLVSRSPAAGATDAGTRSEVEATFSEPVDAGSIAMVLKDAGGAVLPSTAGYDAATRVVFLLQPTPELTVGATYTVEVSGARDAAGNVMAPESWSFTVATCPCAFFDAGDMPAVTDVSGGGALELGMQFLVTTDGFVTGVRYYRGSNSPGDHVVSLWERGTGLRLASAPVPSTAAGWQTVTFATPVAVSSTQPHGYVVSYFAPQGGFAYSPGFVGTTLSSGPLFHSGSVGDGYYHIGWSAMPTTPYSNNYWVSPVFDTAP
jgi:methionine-rich copper-binding protein CopC